MLIKRFSLDDIRDMATLITQGTAQKLSEPIKTESYGAAAAEVEIEVKFGLSASQTNDEKRFHFATSSDEETQQVKVTTRFFPGKQKIEGSE